MGDIVIDFEVLDRRATDMLYVADFSEWGIIVDKPSIIEITAPGYEKPSVHYFKKGAINGFNSLNLGLNCNGCGDVRNPLDDGIYIITVKGSPDKYSKTKHLLRTVCFENDLDKLFINAVTGCRLPSKEKMDYISKARFYLNASKANLRHGNYKAANKLFGEAIEVVKKYDCVFLQG